MTYYIDILSVTNTICVLFFKPKIYVWSFAPDTFCTQPCWSNMYFHFLTPETLVILPEPVTIVGPYLQTDNVFCHHGTVSISRCRLTSTDRYSHYKDKTVLRPSYLDNGIRRGWRCQKSWSPGATRVLKVAVLIFASLSAGETAVKFQGDRTPLTVFSDFSQYFAISGGKTSYRLVNRVS